MLPAEQDIHLAKKPPNKFPAELGMIVEIAQLARAKAGIARVQADNFPFPLRLEDVPIGLKLGGFRHLRVVSDGKARDTPFVDEDKFPLGLDVEMFSFPPKRSIHDFRQDQERRQGIEQIVVMKTIKRGGTTQIDVGEILAASALGEKPG